MNRKTLISIALLLLSPLIIYFLWPSDESRIHKLFKEGAKAIEQKKLEDIMSKVSYNYTDDQGFSYITIKNTLEKSFQRMSAIEVEYEIKNLVIKGTSATADLDLRLIASYGQETGYIVGDAAKPARMKFFLEKERTSWLVNKTEDLYHP